MKHILLGAFSLMIILTACNNKTKESVRADFIVGCDGFHGISKSYIPNNNRSQIIKKETNTIILDAYNANPTSMMAALQNFVQSRSPNKIVFLGDMFELGITSEEEHQYISDYLEKYLDGQCYLIGNAFS